jgi:hypothetical protein
MNRIFECVVSKPLNQVLAEEKDVSEPGQSRGAARMMKRAGIAAGIALAVALLGACSSEPGGSNYAAASDASGNHSGASGVQAGRRA